MKDMSEMQRRCLTDSRAWFPLWDHGGEDELIHFALGLAGETGEVVEHIKKYQRGDDLDHLEVGRELADVVIYAMNMAQALGIDLYDAIVEKRARNVERWGETS